MEIENQKATSLAKLWMVRMPLLIVLVLLVLTVMEVLPSAIWLILSAGVFIITLLMVLVGRLHYINFSIKADEVLIRHYHLFPLITDYQEIIITKSDNPHYTVKKSLFGLIPILNIEITTSQGKAVYPPIPLSLISRDKRNSLLSALGI